MMNVSMIRRTSSAGLAAAADAVFRRCAPSSKFVTNASTFFQRYGSAPTVSALLSSSFRSLSTVPSKANYYSAGEQITLPETHHFGRSSSPSSSDICKTFELQSKKQWQIRKSTPEERIERLQRLRAVYASHEGDIRAALRVDNGKDDENAGWEFYVVLEGIDDAVANLAEWMKPTAIEPSPENANSCHECKIIYEPKGVVLILGPWNYPMNLLFQPLVAAIAAGNTAMVKPNELTPAVDSVTAKIIREAFPPEEVAAFEGGIEVINELQELPVDHVFFTGSPAVGKIVMAAAAKQLASVTLELGGKNPVIVDGNTDIAAAAQNVAYQRCYNMGQICINPENVWVHEDKKDEFVEGAAKMFRTFYKDNGELNIDMMRGRIINKRNLDRIKGYIDDAKAKGANIVCGGEVIEDALAVHPTILTDLPSDCRILSEEVFGPILSIFTYRNIEEVYQALHKEPKPLAMYVFSQDDKLVEDILANTSSGGVAVNRCIAQFQESNLPFGGVGNSGMGSYHSIHGFKELSHARAVMHLK